MFLFRKAKVSLQKLHCFSFTFTRPFDNRLVAAANSGNRLFYSTTNKQPLPNNSQLVKNSSMLLGKIVRFFCGALPRGPSRAAFSNFRNIPSSLNERCDYLGNDGTGLTEQESPRLQSHTNKPEKMVVSLSNLEDKKDNSGDALSAIQLNFGFNAQEMIAEAQKLISTGNAFFDSLAQIQHPSLDNFVVPWAEWEGRFSAAVESLTFPQHVSTDSGIQEASVQASKLFIEFSINLGVREDLYSQLKHVRHQMIKNEETGILTQGDELERFVEKTLLGFKHNGLELNKEQRDLLKAKRQRLADLSVDFQRAIAEDTTEMRVKETDLEGCPPDFIQSLREVDAVKNDDDADGANERILAVTMKYPDVLGIMKYAKRESVRRRLEQLNGQRCPQNIPILLEAIQLRKECAEILGYASHAHFQLEDRLAKHPTTVSDFLGNLRSLLTPHAQRELQRLQNLKKQEDPNSTDTSIGTWEFAFYHRLLMERDYAIDSQLVRQYFPLDHVNTQMLAIYEELLGLKFKRITDIPAHLTWHPDTQLFEVKDAASAALVGYFYLDLHPRDGKYTHAACWSLQPGYTLDILSNKKNTNNVVVDGHRSVPVAAIVANFTKPTGDKPSLLTHAEVVTHFHEFGHAMHGLCSKTLLARFHGIAVETDWVEAPSQLLENWCWTRQTLLRLTKHWQTGEPMPLQLLNSLIAAKNVNEALANLRQIFYATLDLHLHNSPHQKSDPQEMGKKVQEDEFESLPPVQKVVSSTQALNAFYADLRTQIGLIPQSPDIYPLATFGHIMGGYDAGYYGYLYSQSMAADMFYSVFNNNRNSINNNAVNNEAYCGLLDVKIGAAYRQHILQPGGSRDGLQSFKAFVGRDPSPVAFLRSLGLSVNHDDDGQ